MFRRLAAVPDTPTGYCYARRVAPTTLEQLELPITGMSCASCAGRVERRLNELDGVSATVNYATERASVRYDAGRTLPGDLLDAVAAAGYAASLPSVPAQPAAVAPSRELRRVALAAALSLPVLLLAMVPALQWDGWAWVAGALATPVVLWAGLPVHRAAWRSARHATATMDTLVSLGALVAWGWSVVALLAGGAGAPGMRMAFSLVPDRASGLDDVFFEVACVVVTATLAGRALEARAKRRAGSALRALHALAVKDVTLLGQDGGERRVPLEELAVGARFLVRPGERVATDGEVEEGASAVDEALLTGESVPVEKGPGDAVTGATTNLGGRLVVRATRVGADTALAQVARLVTQAQSGKAPVQRLADRVAAVFVPAVLTLAALTLTGWLVAGASAGFAVSAAVAVLVAACPCALGLATPTALLVGTGRGAQLGLLIRGPEVLEATRAVDTVVLDKTGTVTSGRMVLMEVIAADPAGRAELLGLAGALEAASTHPVARAVADAARADGPLAPAAEVVEHPGLGLAGRVGGRAVLAGRPALLAAHHVPPAPALERARAAAEARGRTVVALAVDGRARGLLVVADTPKAGSAEAVRRLRALGLRPILLSGDNRPTAAAVAAEVGIPEVVAEVLPAGKAAEVRRLQAAGRVVAMVGDGVNDAPALAQADLGIALGTGADVAVEASDLTLVGGDLRGVADALRLSRRTLATIRQNLFWAFAYNVVLLPVAVAGDLDPVLAGVAMAASSLLVVANALRLGGFRAERDA